MMKITLSDQERLQLTEVFQTTADARLRLRCQAILMAHRGRRHRHIAEDLGVTARTLQRWLRAYQAMRLAGLQLRWRPGRTARIPAALAPEILGWILQGPAGCGPTYHYLKADPEQQMLARQDLQALKKRPRRESSSC
jgi:transposase